MPSNNYIYKMSNAGGMSTVTRYADMLAGNAVWNPWEPAGAYESIAAVTVPSGGVASVTFSSIPQNYAHLQIRAIAKDTQSTGNHSFFMLFNSDSAANYSYHAISGNNNGSTTASGVSNLSASFSGFITATDTTNIFAPNIIDVLDYSSNVKNKTTRTLGGADLNGSGQIQFISTGWFSTSPITSIAIFPAATQTLQQHSQFALYGIKG